MKHGRGRYVRNVLYGNHREAEKTVFFVMIRRPTRSTLFPYTTRFRSAVKDDHLTLPSRLVTGISKTTGLNRIFRLVIALVLVIAAGYFVWENYLKDDNHSIRIAVIPVEFHGPDSLAYHAGGFAEIGRAHV